MIKFFKEYEQNKIIEKVSFDEAPKKGTLKGIKQALLTVEISKEQRFSVFPLV